MHRYKIKIFKLRYKVQRFVWKQMPWISYKKPKLGAHIEPRLKLGLNKVIIPLDETVITYFDSMYMAHRFDLLGSGWICRRVSPSRAWNSENVRPREKARLRSLITLEYQPIDWHVDPAFGTSWSTDEWGWQIRTQQRTKKDIKSPWELARGYHLPRLAVLAVLNPEKRTECFSEFQNQVCDFLMANPFRRGVNWAIAMEAAIRAINWLLAYDILIRLDKHDELSADFKDLFAQSIYEHGQFIYDNLEFSGNHYLADLAGLIFIGVYLGGRRKAGKWLRFAYAEFIDQIDQQFYRDGGNYEASTCYHRLSTEIVLYTAALILGLDEKIKQKLPGTSEIPLSIWNKIFRACRFTSDISRENGMVPQFGDNDSGRLVSLSPCGEFMTNQAAEAKYVNLNGYLDKVSAYDEPEGLYWDENYLDHTTLVAAAAGLFDGRRFEKAAEKYPLEKWLITALARENRPDIMLQEPVNFHESLIGDLPNLEFTRKKKYFPQQKGKQSLRANMSLFCYPDSGVYLFKSDRVYLAVCAMPNGQNGNGGHSHNDKLSFELTIDGVDFALDPGTFCYTANPETRNRFRSGAAHNIIHTDVCEQNEFTKLFGNDNSSHCWLKRCEKNKLVVGTKFRSVIQYREFIISDTVVEIIDYSTFPITDVDPFPYYSNGYGKLIHK